MKTRATINKARDGIYAEITSGLSGLNSVRKSQVESLVGASVDAGLASLSEILAQVESIVKAPMVEGISLPQFIAKISTTDEGTLTSFTLSIRSKLKAAVKYKKEYTIAVDSDVIINISNAFVESLFELFYQELANENVEALNAKVTEICEANGLPTNFKFVVSDAKSVIVSIDNDMVVFNADVNRALGLALLPIFQSGDEYSDMVCKDATEKLVEQLKTCQTTTQLIKGNVSLIKDVTDISTKKRASKLIRGAYHRKAENLDKVKEGVGYFEDTVKVGKEDVKVFALVEKAADGKLSVVLNPFDVTTLFAVDFDVLKAIK